MAHDPEVRPFGYEDLKSEYNMTDEQIAKLDRMGEKSAKNVWITFVSIWQIHFCACDLCFSMVFLGHKFESSPKFGKFALKM